MDPVKWSYVAGCASENDCAFDGCGHQDGEVVGSLGIDTIGDETLGNQLVPPSERCCCSIDNRCGAAGIVGIRLNCDRQYRAAGTVIGAQQVFTVEGHEVVKQVERAGGFDNFRRDKVGCEVDCFAQQLGTTAREIVVRRSARCATGGQDIGDCSGLRAALTDEQSRRGHHSFTRCRHAYVCNHT